MAFGLLGPESPVGGTARVIDRQVVVCRFGEALAVIDTGVTHPLGVLARRLGLCLATHRALQSLCVQRGGLGPSGLVYTG